MITVFNKLEAKMKELGIDTDKINKVVEFAKSSDGIPSEFRTKDDYKKLKGEFESFKTVAKEKEDIISNLKEKAESVEEYESKLEEIKSQLEEKDNQYSETIEKMKFENALDRIIAQDKEINPKARDTYKKLLDVESMKLDGDDLLGYEKQAGLIKEKHDYLIIKSKFKGQDPNKNVEPGEADKDNPFKAGDSFNLTKQGKLIKSDPEKAKLLIKQAGKDPLKFGLK